VNSLNYGGKLSLVLTSLATLGFIASQPATAASLYSITDLGLGIAEDINELGQVVGGSGVFQREGFHAFVWSKNEGFTELDLFGSDYSLATSINNLGQVVGTASNTSGDYLAFLWSQDTGSIDLGTLTSPEVPFRQDFAAAINDSGQVVGSSFVYTGFLWSQSTGITQIPIYFPSDINNLGQVVGSSGTPGSGTRAELWSESTGTRNLGSFGGYYSGASGINDLGQVVGVSRAYVGNSQEVGRAFLWSENTGLTNLGILGDDPGSQSFANDINNLGQVVGTSQIASGDFGPYHAFLWENGVMSDLNDLLIDNSGWVLSDAEAINENGQIVGTGLVNGETHAFVLNPISFEPEPVPEPSSVLGILAMGVFSASSLFKRSKRKGTYSFPARR
jgi:probable HAF family extracellular repeat protein